MNHSELSRRLAALALLIAVGYAVITPATSAHAVDDGSVGIRPATESDFFHLSARPGETIEAAAVVSNFGSSAAALLTYPVDAVSEPGGAFAMAAQADAAAGVGAWVRLAADRLDVPPGQDVPLTFQLTVPTHTVPGDYAGAIIIQSPPVEGETTTVDGMAVRLDVVQRQGVRIYLRVEGERQNELSVGSLDWQRDGDDLVFALTLRNDGSTELHPEAAVALTGWSGRDRRAEFHMPELLAPGTEVVVHARLTDAPPLHIGAASASVASEAGPQTIAVDVVYGPWLVMGLGLLALIAGGIGGWRFALFVKRARVALAAQAGRI